MANIIQIKRKTTTGAPSLGQLSVGEGVLVLPDNTLYYKKDAGTLLSWPSGAGAGDMLVSIFDPNSVGGDVFDMDNMVEGTNTKVLTSAERSAIASNSSKVSYTDSAAVALNTSKPDATAITAEIGAAIDALIGGAPGALDTLNELAQAMADDDTFSATVTAALATKLDSNSTIDGGTI